MGERGEKAMGNGWRISGVTGVGTVRRLVTDEVGYIRVVFLQILDRERERVGEVERRIERERKKEIKRKRERE